ncbi:M24 family metallopeptidase [Candidatus Hodarchaeum mangrovi]
MDPIGYNRERTAKILKKHEIDLLIGSSGENVFYTTGLPTLHVANNPILWALRNQYPFLSLIQETGEVDLIYWMVFASLDHYSWIKSSNAHGVLSPIHALKEVEQLITSWQLSGKTIALESTMPRYQSEYLQKKFPNSKFVEADPVFLEMRLIKSTEEIQRIKKSTEISEKAILACIEASYDGITDNDLLKLARSTIISSGAEGWDHLTLGIGSSDPEAPGIGIQVKPGDVTRFDFGAVWKGYVSDISRHMVIGSVPDGIEEILDRVIKVQEFCVNEIKPGVDPGSVFKAARNFSKTLSKFARIHPTCHSIGLEVEETHIFSAIHKLESPFQANMVCDIEVWHPVANLGLIGVEDCYQVTSTGCKRLSTLDKTIFVK